jgi:hypothetical protein
MSPFLAQLKTPAVFWREFCAVSIAEADSLGENYPSVKRRESSHMLFPLMFVLFA